MDKNEEKVVIVTGCSGAIGRSICTRLINLGYCVIGLDAVPPAFDLKDFFQIDLSNLSELREVWEMIDSRYAQSLYGLVNNAGVYEAINFFDLSPKEYDRILSINLKAPVFISQKFSKTLLRKEGGGTIVNIASISGEIGSADVAYGVSKGGAINLTKSLSIALSPKIRVNGVNPGVVESDMSRRIPVNRMEEYLDRTLNGSLAKPDDVARAVEFLIDENNTHINAATIKVDGGFH